MRLADMNWMQVQEHVKHDQRAVLPLGSTEQHGYLSLCVDMILAERVAIDAAKTINVPVYPTINYGFTPSFVDYPGTVSLRLSILEWLDRNRGVQVKWHNWWSAPRTLAKVKEIDPLASHASWMENLPWTRLAGVVMPTERKPMINIEKYMRVDPAQKKLLIGDGNFGGLYQRPDEELMAMWDVAVDETRALIEGGWD